MSKRMDDLEAKLDMMNGIIGVLSAKIDRLQGVRAVASQPTTVTNPIRPPAFEELVMAGGTYYRLDGKLYGPYTANAIAGRTTPYNPRIDRVVLNPMGMTEVLIGTPSPSPAPPCMRPGDTNVTQILVTPAGVSAQAIA